MQDIFLHRRALCSFENTFIIFHDYLLDEKTLLYLHFNRIPLLQRIPSIISSCFHNSDTWTLKLRLSDLKWQDQSLNPHLLTIYIHATNTDHPLTCYRFILNEFDSDWFWIYFTNTLYTYKTVVSESYIVRLFMK